MPKRPYRDSVIVNLVLALLILVFFLPPGDSIGGRILSPILDGLYSFLVGI